MESFLLCESRWGKMTSVIHRDRNLLSVVDFIQSNRFETGLDLSFKHNDAPVHSAADVKEYVGEYRIQPIMWPPYFPASSPI